METQTSVGLEALMSPDEAASILGISRRTLEGYVRARKIPFVKLGHLTKFRPQTLRQWIEAQERQVMPAASGRE